MTKIQLWLNDLADECLEASGKYREYTGADLCNSTVIFSEVLLAKAFDYWKTQKMTLEEMEARAFEVGNAMRRLIFEQTGIDMHVAVKEDYPPKPL